ncbi:hypothetical protein [Egicoccus sp. AB-alg6-2]|uniref:hypothetical protein n=1 Tax=Egicoccus sp. AB-alg6-2 TaxID=3242692 RepID=UPI00359E14A4
MREDLQAYLGSAEWARKEQDFVELGQAPWIVVFDGSDEVQEVRNTFASGNYRAAAGAAGALGERFLNMLVRDLREEFPPASVQLARRWSSKWQPLVRALEDWGVFTEDLAAAAMRLAALRNMALHRGFASDGRSEAMEAHGILRTLMEGVLGGLPPTRWFIQHHAHEPLIAEEYEAHPVVQVYYAPQSAYVGPWHKLDFEPAPGGMRVVVHDSHEYADVSISDDEFLALRREGPPLSDA